VNEASLAQSLVDAAAKAWDDDLVRYVCCDENLAMCGQDLTGAAFTDDEDHDCPLCVMANEDTCPRCGE